MNSTASYSIDLPNGGNAVIQNNIIQQGSSSHNPVIITAGEEGNSNPTTNFLITGNTILNDLVSGSSLAVRNSTTATAQITNNKFFGLTSSQIASGPNAQIGDQFLTTEPQLNTTHPWSLLVNGSFEATALGVGKAAGFQSIAGWTALTGGTIELWNAVIGVTATQGVNFAELDYLGGYDGFYQDVGTTAGQAYTLSFDLRSRPGYAISTQGVEVVWNGQVVATTYPGTAWSTFSVNVNGTGGQDRLTIREVQGQSGDGIGALLDNFRLTSNQQPAAQVSVAAAPALVTEGTNPSTTVSFSLNAVQASPVTVTYSTVNGTAVDGSDFTGATGATVVIPAGQTSFSVTIPILNDAISEPNETFSVVLNGATLSGQSIATGGPATITILDNDPVPTGSNLLVNGSFEATALGVGQAAGFQSVAGWTALTGGTIELWNAVIGVTATQGVNFAELDYLGGYDGFYQDIGTAAGQAYTLSFDLRSRPGYAISTQGVEVVWMATWSTPPIQAPPGARSAST